MILLEIIDIAVNVYMLMIFARIIGSWVPELQQYRFMHFIAYYVDPYLNFFRRFIPPLGMIDISPIFAFIALALIEYFLKMLIVSIFL